ncbi:phosphoribosylglycinamide formyltransferase [Salinimonas chungwhensis]|uniref:phosphoribosylglycinamide formyltransferase n=1 Tax=Salinimonas chungwhensis TaxID=265425 RepID=UPI00036FF40B|nr:phosphoribosylglycinamide formyltransferase [Salinimonas chungwhensis]
MTAKKNICVLISGSGSNLQALMDACSAGKINGQIVAVISNKPNAYGLERARKAAIATHIVSYDDYSSRAEYDAALSRLIIQVNADCIVLAGFMRILTPGFVDRFSGKLLNVHPSLLPKYKGLNTHQRAIDNKDPEHGVSVHFVTAELDGGPVIVQSRVPVFEYDTAEELAERVNEQELRIYPLVVKWFCDGRLAMKDNKAIFDDEFLPETGYASD